MAENADAVLTLLQLAQQQKQVLDGSSVASALHMLGKLGAANAAQDERVVALLDRACQSDVVFDGRSIPKCAGGCVKLKLPRSHARLWVRCRKKR